MFIICITSIDESIMLFMIFFSLNLHMFDCVQMSIPITLSTAFLVTGSVICCSEETFECLQKNNSIRQAIVSILWFFFVFSRFLFPIFHKFSLEIYDWFCLIFLYTKKKSIQGGTTLGFSNIMKISLLQRIEIEWIDENVNKYAYRQYINNEI